MGYFGGWKLGYHGGDSARVTTVVVLEAFCITYENLFIRAIKLQIPSLALNPNPQFTAYFIIISSGGLKYDQSKVGRAKWEIWAGLF